MAENHVALLLTPEGWELLSSLPPYDPSEALSLGRSLREEGHSPALVAAALTQHVDDFLAAGGESSEGSSERLAQRAGVDVYAAVSLEKFADTVTCCADNAG